MFSASRKSRRRPRPVVLASGLLLLLLGCGRTGPELAPVSGRVTLDGEPVVGKMVSFTPESFTPNTQSGRSSVGYTDENGEYELYYTAQKKGALITRHIVTIATPEDARPPQPENIPAKYRIDTILRAEVKDESNVFDWELTSDGDDSASASR